ncbi:ribonuclease D [Kocuria rhizophila]|uniref:Putative ribonuclease D n=1 Tax=Kocuria rhizophila (strain ATCC 9341 / DSM 348 / NBRC 103217 / DC2201) TaxID=378753 RepID=B2GJ53_KOCRD|nr:HRDC domain-containing protein [Kocuria rhizophila]ASE10379.1 ribonuclease D [Kocuria rhizophila]MBK4120611.1 ribonuclease D [Kocuria rhizophila]MCC5672680.1 ribonuclease D [Kocuria rhizophila]MCC5675034.1 ribonuclease D [Kocuria rhizophila]MDV5999306.1 ribonuclease D [Kocuria rhizophila]
MVPGFEHLAIPATVHLNGPAEGLPRVVDTARGLSRAAEQLAAAHGPVAVDTERASGFRYGQRAFLVQLRREGAGTVLIDPEAVGSLAEVDEALRGVEWVLHAATQDMPCLAELDMHPDELFDTELGGRLLGLRKVGLASMTEELLGFTLSKEHSAVDWSQRPLPVDWLNYAALDVEVLVQLRWATEERLARAGKLDWALEEFEHVRTAPPPAPRQDPWRRTHGLGNVRGRRKLTAVRNLWLARESLAEHKDLAPTRLLPDSAIIAAANAMPRTVPQLMSTPGFHGRLASREAPRWLAAVQEARLTEEPVPATIPSTALPPVKGWETKRPEASARLKVLKPAVAALAEELELPTENLLTPEHLRRFCWQPPRSTSDDAVAERLRELGARSWQVERVAPVIGAEWRALRARRRADKAGEPQD